jgi:hypothetical protein
MAPPAVSIAASPTACVASPTACVATRTLKRDSSSLTSSTCRPMYHRAQDRGSFLVGQLPSMELQASHAPPFLGKILRSAGMFPHSAAYGHRP